MKQITSNDIVAKLVDNGLSYDYASKVKNKIIESLNEKFEFITGSNEPFINISKSSQDKRIQILSLIKNLIFFLFTYSKKKYQTKLIAI